MLFIEIFYQICFMRIFFIKNAFYKNILLKYFNKNRLLKMFLIILQRDILKTSEEKLKTYFQY